MQYRCRELGDPWGSFRPDARVSFVSTPVFSFEFVCDRTDGRSLWEGQKNSLTPWWAQLIVLKTFSDHLQRRSGTAQQVSRGGFAGTILDNGTGWRSKRVVTGGSRSSGTADGRRFGGSKGWPQGGTEELRVQVIVGRSGRAGSGSRSACADHGLSMVAGKLLLEVRSEQR